MNSGTAMVKQNLAELDKAGMAEMNDPFVRITEKGEKKYESAK